MKKITLNIKSVCVISGQGSDKIYFELENDKELCEKALGPEIAKFNSASLQLETAKGHGENMVKAFGLEVDRFVDIEHERVKSNER
jgi:hypothetical protein